MGIFPYTCEACGGADVKCCNERCEEGCTGGQFCYRDEVVIFVNDKRIEGVYDGYGQVKINENHIYIPSEFNEFINDWKVELSYDPKQTNIIIYCKGCDT